MKRTLGERVYGFLLWLHPPAFRRQCGAEILQVVRTMDRSASRAEMLAIAARDGLASLRREWAAVLRGKDQTRRRQSDIPGEPMRNIVRDFIVGARLLARTPAFTAAAVLTLALGIGANTAMFTLADATLLRPIPVRDPHQLVVWSWSSSWPHYLEYARRTDIFDGVLASGGTMRLNLAMDGASELVQGALYSGNAFDVLGIRAAAGRTLLPSDDAGGAIVVVLSHNYWRTRFGASPAAVGRAIRINGQPATIVGVAEPGFRGTSLTMNPDLFLPAAVSGPLSTGFFSKVDRLKHTGFVWLAVIGRLRPDVTVDQAAGAMDALYGQLQPPEPGASREEALRLVPLETRALGEGAADVRTFVNLLLGVVAMTLLIGCANLANLLLAKAAARRREMGVRLALGATRARIVQQLLIEAVLLALIGGAAGLAVAVFALQALQRFELPGGLRIASIPLDLSAATLMATFALSLLTGLFFGAAPAWRASRADVLVTLRDQSRASTARTGIRSVLLAAQVAMCLVLLVGTGLFARSLMSALETRLGFDPAGVDIATVNLGLARYDAPRAQVFYQAAIERVRALPRVQHVAWTNLVPTRGAFMWNTEVEGTGKSLTVYSANVGPDYFNTIRTPIVTGRPFLTSDTATTERVGIVNETMAREYFGAAGAIGSRIKVLNTWVRIVGVAEDTVVEQLREKPSAQLYLAFDQWLDGPRGTATDTAHLMIRAEDGPSLLPMIREQLRALDPELPLYDVVTFEDRVAGLTMPQRMGVTLFTLFSAIALALAAVGIYGVASYTTALRTREFGVRLALGSSRRAIGRLILLQGAWPVLGGIAAGTLLAIYAARGAGAFLVDVSPIDPVTFITVTTLLAAVALAASYVPARRASRIEPIEALRED